MAPPAGKPVDDLDAELDKPFPEAWRPEPGDVLKGTFLRLTTGWALQERKLIAIVVDAEGVEHGVWLLTEVLENAFRRERPQPGERIAIRYEGMKKSKNPKPGTSGEYRNYRLVVDRPAEAGEVDWAAELGEEQRAAAPVEAELDELPI